MTRVIRNTEEVIHEIGLAAKTVCDELENKGFNPVFCQTVIGLLAEGMCQAELATPGIASQHPMPVFRKIILKALVGLSEKVLCGRALLPENLPSVDKMRFHDEVNMMYLKEMAA